MVEELLLPNSSSNLQLARHSFTAPLLPSLHEDWQRVGIQFRPAKEMHVIRHDDVASNRPAMVIMRAEPFIAHYGCNFICCEDRSSSQGAGSDEINGVIDPDA